MGIFLEKKKKKKTHNFYWIPKVVSDTKKLQTCLARVRCAKIFIVCQLLMKSVATRYTRLVELSVCLHALIKE